MAPHLIAVIGHGLVQLGFADLYYVVHKAGATGEEGAHILD